MSDAANKTEEPTPKRLEEAHDEGRFARSVELQVVFTMLSFFLAVVFTLEGRIHELTKTVTMLWGKMHRYPLSIDSATWGIRYLVALALYLLGPMLIALVLGSLLGGGIQSGFRLSWKALGFKWERISLEEGWKRLVGGQNWVQLGVDGLKFVLLGWVLYGATQQILNDPLFYTSVEVTHVGPFLYHTALAMWARFCALLTGVAALNYLYQWYSTRQKLRMTRQEVKDEVRQQEADAQIRRQQRQRAYRLLQKQMLGEIPTADVVVTNPTHYAIALKYEHDKDMAPIVLAKGEGLFARRIKSLAAQHSVPTVEDKPTARLLYKLGQVGQPIPQELYDVIAHILNHVYRTHRYYFHTLKARRNRYAKPSGGKLEA